MTDFPGIGLHPVTDEPDDNTPEPTCVLIADDDAGTRLLLQNKLEKAGYAVIAAKNGREAINRVTENVAAAVLDLKMPDIDGLACLRHIRGHFPDLSPVMLTASENIANAVEAMKEGALDYVIKPIHSGQLIALIEKAVDGFEQARRLRLAEQKLEQARKHQVFVASQIQQTLLLGHPPEDVAGLSIAHLTLASQQIDGDFYDFFHHSSHLLDLIVADIMGKGIMAAFMGAALKSAFLRVLGETGPQKNARAPAEPAVIVHAVHEKMIRQMESLETFVTLCYGRFDMCARRFDFVDCGHVRPIHYHSRSGTVDLLSGSNMPLGFPETGAFEQFSADFAPGDVFVFYSDGVTEAANAEGEMFEESRLVDYIKANGGDRSPTALVEGIRRAVIDFSGTDVFNDDFTCVAVRIEDADADTRITETRSLEINSDLHNLKTARSFLKRFCGDAAGGRIDDDRIAQLEVAATEVITNIIKHAYDRQPDRPIRIGASAGDDALTIDFFDWGRRFDPAAVPLPVLDGSQENGMGCYIIAQSVDRVDYFHDPAEGKNCARLKIMLLDAAKP
ncbi:MAG: ATP-binding SpoIIE family protein phosphatase [Thermodesulfobacteriota bacterium]